MFYLVITKQEMSIFALLEIQEIKGRIKFFKLLYLFHERKTGFIIVCGGKKGTQSFDIMRFRNMKKDYLKQKS